jgi:hypothetical protein
MSMYTRIFTEIYRYNVNLLVRLVEGGATRGTTALVYD